MSSRAGISALSLRSLALAALGTAALALYNTVRARRAEREHPPLGRFITVDGVRLHYLERGEGPPVVLLHGNVVTAEDFALSGLFDRLAERHRVIAFDRPGYGYSERPRGAAASPSAQAELVYRALAELGIDKPIVVGHSFGTLVALALALDHPEAVSGVAVLSGYYYPTPRADVMLSALAAIPVLGDLMRYTVSPLLGAATLPLVFKTMFGPSDIPQLFAKEFPRRFPVRPSQIRAEWEDGAGMTAAAAELQRRLGELTMPVVIVAGEEDRVVDVGGHAKRLHAELPDSILRLVPGAGHMVHYAAPDAVVEAIEQAATAAQRRARDPAMA